MYLSLASGGSIAQAVGSIPPWPPWPLPGGGMFCSRCMFCSISRLPSCAPGSAPWRCEPMIALAIEGVDIEAAIMLSPWSISFAERLRCSICR